MDLSRTKKKSPMFFSLVTFKAVTGYGRGIQITAVIVLYVWDSNYLIKSFVPLISTTSLLQLKEQTGLLAILSPQREE